MAAIFDFIVFLLYPAIVLFGLAYLNVRYTALLLLVLLGRRFVGAVLSNRGTSIIVIVQAAATAAIIGGAAISGSSMVLRFAPLAIALTFVVQFVVSLRGIPIIERFARLKRPDLPPDHVAYCRRLTWIWVAVLAGNSALVGSATLVQDQFTWALLVGPVSYVYIGGFITVEYLYRKRRFQDFDAKSPLDRLLKAILGREVTQ